MPLALRLWLLITKVRGLGGGGNWTMGSLGCPFQKWLRLPQGVQLSLILPVLCPSLGWV